MPTEEEEYQKALAAYYAGQKAKYGLASEDDLANQNASSRLSVPLGEGMRVSPTLEYQEPMEEEEGGLVMAGLRGQGDDLSGYANVGINKMGPQNVNAGISGSRGRFNANIPIQNPAGLSISAGMDLATKNKIAIALDLTPMERAVFLGIEASY
jgi:hypothetical protein